MYTRKAAEPRIPSRLLHPQTFLFQSPDFCEASMGQAKSRRRGCVTLLSKKRVRSLMDLSLLPQELLVLILSWVPGRTLVTVGRLVCRQWRDLIDSPTLWKLQAERDPSKCEAFQAALQAVPHRPHIGWSWVGVLKPFRKNLLKNPRGEERFRDWNIQGLCTENGCWITQVVDLVNEGLWEDLLDNFQPAIFVSGSWGTHGKCGCTYNFVVTLRGVDQRPMANFETKRDPIRPEESSVPFQEVSHVFRNYGPGLRKVWFHYSVRHPKANQIEPHIVNSAVVVLSG